MSDSDDKYFVNTKNVRISYSLVGFTLLGAFLFWLAWGLFLNQWLGSSTVGSVWAKNNFKAQYWVYIQPENASSKNYRVIGDISRQDGVYYLEKIYWDKGGYLTFDDCKLSNNDGAYASVDDCQSSKWLNDDDGYEAYSVRVDQKALKQEAMQ